MTKKILAVLIAFFYSIVYTVLGPMVKVQSFEFHTSQIFSFAVCFVLCTIINLLIFSVIPKWQRYMRIERISQCLDKLGDRKLFFVVWGFIFLSWIPAYLILYPGVLSYDIISQVGSALGEITDNHHPVLHTWLIRFFMQLGDALFARYEYGIGIFSLLQMLLLSYALARLVLLLKRRNVPILLVLFVALFSAIWFMNVCLSVTMVKDVMHAAFLVLFACHFTEIVAAPLEYIRKKKNLFLLPLISFLMCAFRNNGIHIYIFCFAVLLVFRVGQVKKVKTYIALIAVILLPIFMYKIYTGPVFDALHIEQGEVREALCVPIQQLQRVAVNKANELTSEQMEQINYYITDLSWREWSPGREYDPFFADPAKSCFISGNYNDNPMDFWKFYIQIGKQFSKEYLMAFLSNTLGYWYPGYYRFSYVMYENYDPEMFVEPLERMSVVEIPILEKYYESICGADFWREIPILRLFVVPGFTLWLLIYALVLSWRKKDFFTKSLPLFLPLIAQYGIMLLSPMTSFRYAWPFYLMWPLAFIGIFGSADSFKLEEKDVETHLEKENDNCNN